MSSLLLSAGFLAQADTQARQQASQRELEKLRGDWTTIAYYVNGQPLPVDETRHITVKIRDDRLLFTRQGASGAGTYRLDPARMPRTIDIVLTDGPDQGTSLKGIYEAGEDFLVVCLAQPGHDRPRDFTARPGTVLEVWKRHLERGRNR